MTDVDPKSPEGLLRRFAHIWRLHRDSPTVLHPLIDVQLDAVLAEHDAAGGTPEADAAVAAQAAADKAAAQEAAATAPVVPPPPDEPFGHVVDPAVVPEVPAETPVEAAPPIVA